MFTTHKCVRQNISKPWHCTCAPKITLTFQFKIDKNKVVLIVATSELISPTQIYK